MASPAEMLEGFEGDGNFSRVENGADNTVVFQIHTVDTSTCYVYDPISGSVVRTQELDPYTEELIGMFGNGTIVTSDYSYEDGVVFKYYRKGKSKPKVIKADMDMVYDFKTDLINNCVIWADSETGALCKVDNNGKKTETKIDENTNAVSEVNVYDRTYAATSYDENSDTGYAMTLRSLDTNEKIIDISNSDWNSFMTTDGFIYPENTENEDGTRTYVLEKTPLSASDKHIRYSFDTSADTYSNFKGSCDNDYALVTSFDCVGNGGLEKLSFIDFKSGKMADVKLDSQSEALSVYPVYNKDLRRWIIGLSYLKDNGYDVYTRLLMIDPTLLKYKTALKAEEFEPQPKTYEVGEKFKEVREAADKIEEKYGIRILVGNEVRLAEKSSQYIFDSREDSEDPYIVEDELFYLAQLDKRLSTYPDDFFEHFKTKNGKFGLRVSLVEVLKNESYNDFSAGGVAYTSGLWYDIAIMSSMLNCKYGSLDHEIWHEVENLVSNNYPLDYDTWQSFDPYGFTYTNDFDGYVTSDTGYEQTLEQELAERSGNTDNVYFVSTYSQVTGMEDRATLIERVVSADTDYETNSFYVFGVKGISKYPHLKAKLDYLADWSKQEFGYVYWETVQKNLAELLKEEEA